MAYRQYVMLGTRKAGHRELFRALFNQDSKTPHTTARCAVKSLKISTPFNKMSFV
jgi:hypothetical protein